MILEMIKAVILLFLWIFSACTNSVYRGENILRTEEFIWDSYRILKE